jgi:hypothetical protein
LPKRNRNSGNHFFFTFGASGNLGPGEKKFMDSREPNQADGKMRLATARQATAAFRFRRGTRNNQ